MCISQMLHKRLIINRFLKCCLFYNKVKCIIVDVVMFFVGLFWQHYGRSHGCKHFVTGEVIQLRKVSRTEELTSCVF